MALHVLAQSRSGFRASLPASCANDRVLALLVEAHALEDLVHFRTSSSEVAGEPHDLLRVDADQTTPAELLESLTGIPSSRSTPGDDNGLLREQRVVVVTNIPIHYRTSLFHEFNAQLGSLGARLQVIFLAGIPEDRSWIDPGELAFEHTYLSSFDLYPKRGGRHLIPRGLHACLERLDPTVVLCAGFSPLVSVRVARWCSRRPGVAFGVWSGEISSTLTAHSRSRRWQRRRLLRRADFAIAYGWRSARYLRTLSPELPIVIGRNTTPAPPLRVSGRNSSVVELLVLSRAEPGKRIDLVIDAVRQLALPNVRLTVIGGGPELENLKARASGSAGIRFRGALSPHEARESYARADIFAFASEYDVFGLVLVEAMAAGLAVVTSREPGAIADLAVDGKNCLIVTRPTVDAWQEALRRVCLDVDLRERLAERARLTVHERWTVGSAASAMIVGCRLAALSIRPR